MEYIVDGYNFAFRAGLNFGPIEHWRKRVGKKLSPLTSGGDTVTIVWDSRGACRPFDLDRVPGPVSHVFACGGTADERIISMVRDSDSPSRIIVVSDDNGVSRPVRNMGARYACVSEIARRLGLEPPPAGRRDPKPAEEEEEKPAPPTGAALDEWMRIFEAGGDEEAP